jgi:hypothetical protein
MGDRQHRCPVCGIERTEQRVIQHLQVSHRKSTLCRLLLQGETNEGAGPGDSRTTAPRSTSTGRDDESNESESTEVNDDATPKPA